MKLGHAFLLQLIKLIYQSFPILITYWSSSQMHVKLQKLKYDFSTEMLYASTVKILGHFGYKHMHMHYRTTLTLLIIQLFFTYIYILKLELNTLMHALSFYDRKFLSLVALKLDCRSLFFAFFSCFRFLEMSTS